MDKLAKLFKAVSDKNRLLIVLAVYQHGELCSCDFSDFLGITPPSTSKHLKILLENKILNSRKSGTWTHYSLDKNNELINVFFKDHIFTEDNLKLVAGIESAKSC